MSCEGNIALRNSSAEVCVTYTTFSSRDFLFFIITQLLMYATFSRIFFLRDDIFLPETLFKQRRKHGSYSKFLLAVINEFLSSLYNYTFLENIVIFRFLWVAT